MLEYELEVRLFRYTDDGRIDPGEVELFRTHKTIKTTDNIYPIIDNIALDMNEQRDVYEEELRDSCEHNFAQQDITGSWNCPDCDRVWSEEADPSDIVKQRKEAENA